MKAFLFRPWFLIVLLPCICAFVFLIARAQSQPTRPPAPVPAQPGATPANVLPPPAAAIPAPIPAPPKVAPVQVLPPPAEVRPEPFPEPPKVAPVEVLPPPVVSSAAAPATGAGGQNSVSLRKTKTSKARPEPIRSIPAGAYYIEKMRQIILPEVKFKEVTLEEAIDFLRVSSRALDTMERDPAKKGVNFILKPDETTAAAKITIDLQDVPMAEALKYITDLGGVKYKVEPFAVVVIPLAQWQTEMFTRTFNVRPDFLTTNGGGVHQTALDLLAAHGVPFPEGGSATFIPSRDQVVVRTNQEGLDITEVLIEEFNSSPEPETETLPETPPAPMPTAAISGNKLHTATTLNVAPAQSNPAIPGMMPAAASAANVPEQAGKFHGEGVLDLFQPQGGILNISNTTAAPASQAKPGSRTEQLLRETELRVLLRHYEGTVKDIADAEKTLMQETEVAKRAALESRLKALEGWKARVAANVAKLEGSITPAAIQFTQPKRDGNMFIQEVPILGPLFTPLTPGGTSLVPGAAGGLPSGSQAQAPQRQQATKTAEARTSGSTGLYSDISALEDALRRAQDRLAVINQDPPSIPSEFLTGYGTMDTSAVTRARERAAKEIDTVKRELARLQHALQYPSSIPRLDKEGTQAATKAHDENTQKATALKRELERLEAVLKDPNSIPAEFLATESGFGTMDADAVAKAREQAAKEVAAAELRLRIAKQLQAQQKQAKAESKENQTSGAGAIGQPDASVTAKPPRR